MPKISVVMPVYNGERYLREAIESILNQTFSDFEFIIINDCSTDATEKIISSYKDSRIKYLKNEKNLGVAETLNKGLDAAKGEYIARMDADDISLPERFKKQLDFMNKKKGIAVCGCGVELFGAVEKKKTYTVFGKENMKLNMLFSSCLAHPAVMMRRNMIEEGHYRYDSSYDKVEDYELWTRIILRHDIDNVRETLFKYRIHSKQVTQNYTTEHRNRSINVRSKLLRNLNVYGEPEEVKAYIYYCFGAFDPEKQFLYLVGLFNKIVETNKETSFFDQAKLKKYLCGIVFSLYERQRSVSSEALIRECSFINKKDFLKRSFKSSIKRLIRGNNR